MRLMKAHIALKTLLAGSLMLAGGSLLLVNVAEAADPTRCPYIGDWNNCFGKKKFKDGSEYEGFWKDNHLDGLGIYT